MPQKTAVIIGAGPAGLTAAYELLTRTDIVPIVLEAEDHVGGLAATIEYKGNRIDIGGHRFFSKSDRVKDWWLNMMPLQELPEGEADITYHGKTRSLAGNAKGPNPETTDRVMLLRNRLSRIYFLRQFFPYPIRLDVSTLRKLGAKRTVRIFFSYLYASLFPVKPEKTLEDFFINRFGRELYQTFFKSYTEKVWGVSCKDLTAEWGAQRVKGLSLWKALQHFAKSLVPHRADVAQKQTETSLIERFLYPKFGPGQMWQVVAEHVQQKGGQVLLKQNVAGVTVVDGRVTSVRARDLATGVETDYPADYVFSTMPMKALVAAMGAAVPDAARTVGEGLNYRDFITVGLLVRKLAVSGANGEKLIKDNWMYIQESDVMVGRIQIFNNWSPSLVAKLDTVWLGLEYFCNRTDDLWKKSDADMIAFATEEISRIGLVHAEDVLDATVLRVPNTYPAYTGTYDRLNELRDYVNSIPNLFLIGRNGMHRYNNQDHSMLTAMISVDNIIAGRTDKSNIWEVNTEQEYHEQKA
jgi:protoporphyrinogen oxidase